MDLSRRNYAALLLPFKADGEIDEQAYRELVRYYLQDAFVKEGGLIANPEAGEIYYLSRAEKRRVLELTLEEAGGKLPVFSGVFDMATRDCVEVARDVKAAGADGLFLMPPAGSMDLVTMWNAEKYPEYWLDQIKAIDAAVGMPIITHPSASPTSAWGIGVPGPAAKLICDSVPNIIGWKMTYNYDGIRKMFKIMRGLDRHVSMFCAGGRYFHEFLAHDKFDGTVSGSWNYALEPMLAHIDAWKRGDQNEALQIWEGGLSELHDYIYGDYSRLHLRYKVAAWLRGLIPHYRMRPPMPAPTQDEIDTIARLLRNAGIEVSSEARKVAWRVASAGSRTGLQVRAFGRARTVRRTSRPPPSRRPPTAKSGAAGTLLLSAGRTCRARGRRTGRSNISRPCDDRKDRRSGEVVGQRIRAKFLSGAHHHGR